MMKDVISADQCAGLHGEIVSVVESARLTVARSANAVITAAYWEIGRRIVTVEQGGRERAEYGQALLAHLAVDLTRCFGRGFSRANLVGMRAFYLAWPAGEICQTVSGKLASTQKIQTLSGKSRADKPVIEAAQNRQAALVEQSAAAAESFRRQAAQPVDSVAQFQL